MGAFEQFPMLTLFIVAMAVLLIVSAIRSRRPPPGQRIDCPQCGASQPGIARFCSRCGKRL